MEPRSPQTASKGKYMLALIVVLVILGIVFAARSAASQKGQQSAASAVQSTTNTQPTETGSSQNGIPTIRTFTVSDVAMHNNKDSCYTTIRGSVYDLTDWIYKHPGGPGKILGLCGKDGTSAFENQHGGQSRPEAELASFKIGDLI